MGIGGGVLDVKPAPETDPFEDMFLNLSSLENLPTGSGALSSVPGHIASAFGQCLIRHCPS